MHNSELKLHLNNAIDQPCVFTHGVQNTVCVTASVLPERVNRILIFSRGKKEDTFCVMTFSILICKCIYIFIYIYICINI